MLDALELFESICGEIKDAGIKKITEEILEGCGRLPLAVKLVATTMEGKTDVREWILVKQILESGKRGVAYACRVVYDMLENKLKNCFLYGTLFPTYDKIDKNYLIECWIADGFLDDFDGDSHVLRAARDHGETVVKELTARCLFEWCSDATGEHVKMPDYFREFIFEAQKKILDEEEGGFWHPVRKTSLPDFRGIWRTAKRISFTGFPLYDSDLPASPESQTLSALLLQSSWWNLGLAELPESFFLHMKNLTILDLSNTEIESLPHSISNLTSLISLYLNGCWRLKSTPPQLKELQKLELLDICGASIKPWLPKEIESLISLRCLHVSFNQERCNHNYERGEARKIISNLKKLEEFIIETDLGQCWKNTEVQIVDALVDLEQLTTLHFDFTSARSLAIFIERSKSWNNQETEWRENTFRSFRFFTGFNPTFMYRDITMGTERHLIFSTDEEISLVDKVIKQASAFELINNSTLNTLSELHLEDWGALKVCVLETCHRLFSVVGECTGVILQSLVELQLYFLRSLQCIWKGTAIPAGSLANLRVLTICGCHELTEILTLSLAKTVSNLEKLHVEDCRKVIRIIGEQMYQLEGQTSVSHIVNLSCALQRVENIKLVHLPELQSICDSTTISWNSLKRIGIIRCGKLRDLSLTPDNAEKLSTISCEESWWTSEQILLNKRHFSRFCRFIHTEKHSDPRAFFRYGSSMSEEYEDRLLLIFYNNLHLLSNRKDATELYRLRLRRSGM